MACPQCSSTISEAWFEGLGWGLIVAIVVLFLTLSVSVTLTKRYRPEVQTWVKVPMAPDIERPASVLWCGKLYKCVPVERGETK